jgi:acetolactate synthase I/II/III large subunit
MSEAMTGTAARAVVDALIAAGVDHAFTVPGESFLGLLDALHDEPRIRVVTTRHEGGASFMAEAYGKLTRRPAVCMATRTVGAANLAIGIHTARQDSTPLVAILGQVPTTWRHREAFQESDLAAMFAPLTKWAVEITDPDRAGEIAYRAARLAVEGRPGPVVLILPENILEGAVGLADRPAIVASRPPARGEDVLAALRLLRAADRPAVILGGGVLASGASSLAVELAEREGLGVFTAWRRPDAFPNDHAHYLGQTGLAAPPSVPARLRAADALLVVGCRLSEITTFGYSVPAPATRWMHVDLEPAALSGDAAPELALACDATEFLAAAVDLARRDPAGPDDDRRRGLAADRRRWEAETTPGSGSARPGFADQQRIAGHIRAMLPPDAIVVTDAGNFSGWGARYLRWNQPGTFLGPTSGAMGYAVPAAIAAKIARPDRAVLALAGDGGFLMTAAEIETAVRERAAIISVVFDNQRYGTIRMHQEHRFPGRPIATDLGAVDFGALTESLGGLCHRVDDAERFPDAFAEALTAELPTTIAVRVDPDQNSVGADSAPRLTSLR